MPSSAKQPKHAFVIQAVTEPRDRLAPVTGRMRTGHAQASISSVPTVISAVPTVPPNTR